MRRTSLQYCIVSATGRSVQLHRWPDLLSSIRTPYRTEHRRPPSQEAHSKPLTANTTSMYAPINLRRWRYTWNTRAAFYHRRRMHQSMLRAVLFVEKEVPCNACENHFNRFLLSTCRLSVHALIVSTRHRKRVSEIEKGERQGIYRYI